MFIDETTEAQPENEAPEAAPETPEPSVDPIDTMTEEDLRKELKKKRAIESRHKDKPQPSNDGDVVKKSDLEKANERLARQHIESAGDELSQEIISNWDDIAKNYISRHGRTTKEDIVEDIMDAHAVWKRKQTAKDTSKNASADVATLTGTGGTSPEATPTERKRLIPTNRPMDKWYD